jgi:hypothetical protein
LEFGYWDVDDVSRGSGVNPVTVDMNAPQAIFNTENFLEEQSTP